MLKGLDVAVQASLSENLGGSIEALLMECPTVATKVGGLVDSVIDGQTGVLVAPADPTELSKGILTLLRAPSDAQELGKRGRQLMLEKFTLRKTVEDEHRLYQLLKQRAPAGYRPSRRLTRSIAGTGVGAYLALRYTVFDRNLLPAWDAGWRPWHFVTLRRLILKLLNAGLRLSAVARYRKAASQRAPVARPDPLKGAGPVNEQFVSVVVRKPPALMPRFRIMLRMMRYRFYAFVGRQKLGWGLRAKSRIMARRVFGKVEGQSDKANDSSD